ncbi:disease resistance protein RUN1 [Trifolium repens]|nr:disease resistance protein RUN1 [Trifolium repens]
MNEYEHTLIGDIVQAVSNKIKRAPLHVADYPVGLESRVRKVNSLLNEACNDGVCMIGIHGTGGIGKSTLARAVYNLIADQFECLCFLEDVRKNSLKHLQEQLLRKTISLELKIGGINEGIGIIKERLHHKKVLLILDDVDHLKQLKLLAGGFNWFGPNSRVIITTRDKSLLIRHGIERIYEVDGFDKGESVELFKWMAFKTQKVDSIDDDIIVNRAISYASGLPLAIDVIGSNMSGKPIAEWKSMLDQYKRIPPKDIQSILKVSFDDLDEEPKNVFLDIACFFKGRSLKEVEGILNAHYGYCIKHDVGVLVDKSLTKIDYGVVWLHDLIEDMGKEVVRQEYPDTRLWFHKDIVEVLEQNKGTSKTKMIYLDCPSKEVEINWNGKAFKKMTNLKTLVIKSGNFSKGCQYFPSSLRVLEWEKYPSAPLSIMNKKFEDMTVLKFDKCEYLTRIPNVSCLPNLEEFSFKFCENLTTIDNSIGFLSKLETLNALGCTKLRSFPPLKLPSLNELDLYYCKSLQNFPEILDKMEKLDEIHISETSIQEIPVSFQNLIGLSSISIRIEGCEKLMFSSSIICNMPNVDIVTLLPRSNLSLGFPMFIKWFTNMTCLDLSGSDIRVLPEFFREFTSLGILHLKDCSSLEDICAFPPNLQRLFAENCKSLNSSSRSMLLNKKLYESGRTELFCFPSEGEMIPGWFNHQSRETPPAEGERIWEWWPRTRETTFSFWFRNKFPFIMIFFSTSRDGWFLSGGPELSFDLCIGDFKRNVYVEDFGREHENHTYLYNLSMQQKVKYLTELMPKLDEAFGKNEWIHAKIKLKYMDTFHLYFKEENNVDDIWFTNPDKKRKVKIVGRGRSRYRTSLMKNLKSLDVEELQHLMASLSL